MERHQSIRLFQNPALEALSHVHPAVPLVLWTPIALWLLHHAVIVDGLSATAVLACALAGLLVWTLSEYCIHRFLFHFPARHPWAQRMIFLFHGIHHADPKDPSRLVMPPAPGLLIMGLLYLLFSLMIPDRYLAAFMAFFIVGYLGYDYIHYATHHFPMRSRLGRAIRRHHLKHHYAGEQARYGVSSPLWDYVFGTMTGPVTNGPEGGRPGAQAGA